MFTLKAAEGESFVNREELLKEMIDELSNLNSTDGYALYGIRRVGKTSILKELKRRLEKKKRIVPVYTSLWDLVEFSVEEFCRRLSEEVLDSYRKLLGIKFRAVELFKAPLSLMRKISSLKIVYEDIEFILSFKGKDLSTLIERTFMLPEKLASATETKCILMIDEFPDIVNLELKGEKAGIRIVKKIRTVAEKWRRTALCISGSIRSTLDLVALSPASPFYRQLIIKQVKPLEKKYVVELLKKNLDIEDEACDEVYRFSGGIPFYVQFIGKILSRKKGRIRIKDVKLAEEEFLNEEGNILFIGDFERLSRGEKLVLKALVQGGETPAEVRKNIGGKLSNPSMVLKMLEDKGIVERKERGRYRIADPVFKLWLMKRFSIA